MERGEALNDKGGWFGNNITSSHNHKRKRRKKEWKKKKRGRGNQL